jgi:hypothetical protein
MSAHEARATLEEISDILDFFRAPVLQRNPETLETERYSLPERLAAHLNPHFVSCDEVMTPAQMMRVIQGLLVEAQR